VRRKSVAKTEFCQNPGCQNRGLTVLLVFDIKNIIKRLNEKVKFHIKWVKGHIGIDGNERADALAKEAADLDLKDSIYNYFPLSFAKRHFKTVTVNKWENMWRTCGEHVENVH